MDTRKCVIVLNENLPLGLLANTAGILGITLGKHMPEAVGQDVSDKSGKPHLGIITFPVPILKASEERLKAIRAQLYNEKDMIAVDFSDIAQSCYTYQEFIEKAAQTEETELVYFGVGICGNKKKVNKLTGNLPLLR